MKKILSIIKAICARTFVQPPPSSRILRAAYDMGFEAEPEAVNPYPKESPSYKAWRDGFEAQLRQEYFW